MELPGATKDLPCSLCNHKTLKKAPKNLLPHITKNIPCATKNLPPPGGVQPNDFFQRRSQKSPPLRNQKSPPQGGVQPHDFFSKTLPKNLPPATKNLPPLGGGDLPPPQDTVEWGLHYTSAMFILLRLYTPSLALTEGY